MNFLDKKTLYIPFYNRSEKDNLINALGFDNFYYVTPSSLFRVLPCFTFHIVLEGSGVLNFNKHTYKLSRGDMFFLPPNVDHCYYPSEEDPWKYAWFNLEGESAVFYGETLGFSQENPVGKCKNFNNVCLLLEHIFTKKTNQIPVGYYDVLSCFFKIMDYNTRGNNTENINLPEAIADYVKGSYNKIDLTVASICDYFNISHSYLCRIFKETHNCSVKNYIVRVRMNEACRLLESTTLGVKEIAFSVGFADHIHFMKTFKAHTQKTPTEYRRNIASASQ